MQEETRNQAPGANATAPSGQPPVAGIPRLGSGAEAAVAAAPEPAKRAPPAAVKQPPLPPRPRRRPRSVFGWFLRYLAVLGAPLQLLTLGLFAAVAFVDVTLPDLPDVKQGLSQVQLQEPLRVYSADGALMAEFGVERRQPLSYPEFPPLLIKAFLATEDSRFFEHGGVDFIGMSRALLNFASTGIKAQGGSTITMQVTRNFFLSPEKTFKRKLAEVLLTLRVEKTLTKEQILELYLNQIFFGHRAYGVAAAATLYYAKDLAQLDVAQMAMLAGIPKAPSSNNPVSNPPRALERRNYILGRMRELGFIDQTQYETAVQTPDVAQLHGTQVDLDAGYMAEMVRQEIADYYGADAAKEGLRVTTTIDSHLQLAAQNAVRKALRQYERRHGYRGPEARVDLAGASEADMDAYLDSVAQVTGLEAGLVTGFDFAGVGQVYIGGGRRITLGLSQVKWARAFKNAGWRGPELRRVADVLSKGDLIRVRLDQQGNWELSPIPAVTGILVTVAPRDGAILAMVSGYDYTEKSQFNRAVDMRRQPGSSFKPFIYASALNKGWTPVSIVKDTAIRIGDWTPQDSDRRELGAIPMRKALALSRNLAAINLLQSVGVDYAARFARRFGFEVDPKLLGPTMALGTIETSPVKMAEAYSVFANGGYHVLPYYISRIENANGDVIYQAEPPHACSDCWFRTGTDKPARTAGTAGDNNLAEQVIDPRIAYQMTSMLRGVVEHGTATRALRLGRSDIVGKTGTTNDIRDSWFCGFQADFVTVAWMGFDDNEKLGRGEEGGRAALSMWTDYMETALKDKPVAKLEAPPGMVKVKVDGRRGVETPFGGDATEEVMEEYRLMLMGPDPEPDTGVSAAPTRKRPTAAKPVAAKPKPRVSPRSVDDLF
ncbi:penicillin-binding protein 1A [uncultured Thiodictyon sp.]|uniref:penicillin-binding protein 1A n=1 Tax=uncultured Thiodictyon sp. TaxID=1846217 RepID=UPI0025FABF6C|nr:PBP1A family penicillin-binding protein [uncultured Thiodictyon sp.]